MNCKQREEAFRKDLAELLKKHRAEMDITDDGKSYGMHSAIVMIYMDGVYDDFGVALEELTQFQL